MKLYFCCFYAMLGIIQGCSSNSSYTSNHKCLDVANELHELATSNVAGISLNMPNNEGSVYFRMNEGQIKAICSSANFKITNRGLVTSTPNQDVYYFQNSEVELVDARKSTNGLWYSKLTPKNKNQWFAVFVPTKT
ncbi:hypothetical protein HII17_08105 [Thalassotalea sp. M1531]|uniref:Lipoprotein n=1 Tax=Thalassotalea algicola TaxID=2716224 RepID=A0A7Y0Q6U6_9GAMM|nr:hypothetical protein [Thalassotalea algicola]NMP31521.1 hypothetical protein [Thalassotalea algicola]